MFNKEEIEKKFEALVARALPNAIREQNNVRYGIVRGVNVGSRTVDIEIIATGDILKGVSYQQGADSIGNGTRCIIVSPDPKNKSQNFAIIFGAPSISGGEVIFTDSTQRTQASPTAGTWYNLGSVSITLPPGVYNMEYGVQAFVQNTSAATDLSVFTTLSTANNSQSDAGYTVKWTGRAASVARFVGMWFYKKAASPIVLSSTTTLFLNTKTDDTASSILNDNGVARLFIKATPA